MSSTKPWYMTAQRRKEMDREFQGWLRQSHDRLLTYANVRETEDVEEIKRLQPNLTPEGVQKVLALNKRINESNRKVEDLIMRIDPRWKE